MRSAAIILILLLTGAAPPSAEFAIECHGEANSKGRIAGNEYDRTADLGRQVYVINQDEEKISRALFPRQEFDKVCGGTEKETFVSVSPGLLLANGYNDFSDDPHTTCEFRIDRMSGEGHYRSRMEWKNGSFHELEWAMDCVATEVPVFDLSTRKF